MLNGIQLHKELLHTHLLCRWFTDFATAGLPLCRIKNKFALSSDELVGGYRDLMLCIVYEVAAIPLDTRGN